VRNGHAAAEPFYIPPARNLQKTGYYKNKYIDSKNFNKALDTEL